MTRTGTRRSTAHRRHDRARKRHATRRTRPAGRTDQRRALRAEAPTILGLLVDDGDFTAMTGYPSFPFTDYGRYLHHVDALLHSLHARGTHVAVTLFDPAAYAAYCTGTRQPPDRPGSRTRYTAEATTAGPAVPYARQPLDTLRGTLAREAEHRATWERATDLLMDAGRCTDCGEELVHCAFDRASHTLIRLVEAVGPGRHHVVASLPEDSRPPLLAAARIGSDEDGELHLDEADALLLCTVMAACAATVHPGGLVIRTTASDGTDTVRGWTLRGAVPHPLTEPEVFNAYCTDPDTGDPVPPEPGVRYAAGIPLPPPLPGDLA
ncbi:hypothetical protein [Actinacidiphila rubida]|uniref:Uncharacterized protein n=1 Tax=Actinacidiphila rubida TaxID=310780 RepID=A0A1H8QAA3_9ACTN|nr:hypothetical protein [Actinacidiphila rubida]SEO51159.1 hypothetical protein SAMN05216267_10294 [Actinacidiphila rubida]